ncbi:MAG: hypothetical protein OQJ97_14320 [Rhodospirillales bacterium]|nr:hypothetical protein [Rhodospirillales bacterium]
MSSFNAVIRQLSIGKWSFADIKATMHRLGGKPKMMGGAPLPFNSITLMVAVSNLLLTERKNGRKPKT